MRLQSLLNPRVFCEKLAGVSLRWRRLAKLRGTPAKNLLLGHIDSLELLEIARPLGIKSIYDIGANVGTWSLLAKAIIPEATVEAFEPLSKHQIDFQNNLGDIDGVTLHRVALGPTDTTADLRVTNSSGSTSLLPITEAGHLQLELEEVERVKTTVRNLDNYQMENGFLMPDLIKMDVQGYELEVLKGATKCLHSAKAVIAEVCFVEYYKDQCLFHDLVGYMAKHDFFVAAFAVCTPIASVINFTDVLFLKRITSSPAQDEPASI